MIYIGLGEEEKKKIVDSISGKYRKIYYFCQDKRPGDPLAGERITWSETILYRFFYRLLAEIDKESLIIVDDFLKSLKRADLTYNCLAKYINQCGDVVAFQYTPFISNPADFMILYDIKTRGKSRQWAFDKKFYQDTLYVPHNLTLSVKKVPHTEGDFAKYAALKKKLFDDLDESHPDTIPRRLYSFTEKIKKCKLPKYDRDFWQFCKDGGLDRPVPATGLPVDQFFLKKYKALLGHLEEYYEQASVYR